MQFTFYAEEYSETIIEGRIATKGRVDYFFKIFGAIAILCVEWKLKKEPIRSVCMRIAQVIAELDGKPDTSQDIFCCRPQSSGCDLNNVKCGFSLPIYCILCDGFILRILQV